MKICPIRLIYPTSRFKQSFKKLTPKIQKLATEKDEIFRKNAFDPRLRTHKLKGRLKNYWSYWINEEYRIVFEFVGKDIVLYQDIGTHEIYQ
ncbi:MAG: type II toxin-antitoxin system YafQ family toxin [Patescibacteria group bacterium]